MPALRRVAPPLIARDKRLRIASLLDLAGMQAATVRQRAEAMDYIDLHALMGAGIDLPSLPTNLQKGIVEAVKLVDLGRLPTFEACNDAGGQLRGMG